MTASAKLGSIKYFRSPKTVIGRFVARRTMRGAGFVALLFGVYVASKSAGFVAAYPSAKERAIAVTALGNNIGLVALLGHIPAVQTVASLAVWNTLPVMAMIGGIWAFLLATKSFRGEEESGRWELLLSGQTTRRQAATNTLLGLFVSLIVFYLVSVIAFILIGRIHSVDFNTSGALFFALAATCGAAMFMAVGTLASQLMPTRARATGLSVIVFGVCFLLRAIGDVSNTQWLSDLSPLGWVANLRPLYDASPIWLVPIILFTLILSVVTVALAGTRDLGDSLFKDHDTAEPHTVLLHGPLTFAIRLTRASSIGWLTAVGVLALVMSLLTKAAAQAFDGSAAAVHVLSKLTQSSNVGATSYLGIVYFMIMILVMCYAASAVGRMRQDEADGYLDNMLVRSTSRTQWLWGRVALTGVVILLSGLLASIMARVGIIGQGTGVSFHTLLLAGLNCIVPALLVLGFGVFSIGALPRLTSVVAYSVIGWSFLLDMVASGINLNHWVLDTSVFHHVAFAPAADPVWKTVWILIGISAALCLIGSAIFNTRDLAGN